MDDVQPDPYEHARTCSTIGLIIAVLLLIVGAVTSNARADVLGVDPGFDWAGFGVWASAAGVVLVIGVCASSICKQLVDSTTT